MQRINPFKPTAGMNPPELIGRDEALDDFAEALENGPGAPDRLMRISGVRGTGKTVLLNALGDLARKQGFQVVDVASNPGFCGRILSALKRQTELRKLSLAPSVMGLSIGSVELARSATQLGEAMYSASRNGGLLVTLDEIQDAPTDEMRELGNEMQLLIRQGANVAFVFAGLPASIDGVVVDETLTFLQRARHIELTRLEYLEVGESIEDTMAQSGRNIRSEAAEMLTHAASGYPFMVQLVGYYAWQAAARRGASEVSADDAQRGIEKARASFDSMVIAPALRRVSARQRAYLEALAACGRGPIATGAVAKRMGTDSRAVGSYRKRLLDAGLIESPHYGLIDFAIPYMREYLLANGASDAAS